MVEAKEENMTMGVILDSMFRRPHLVKVEEILEKAN
jgi:hypothetical protein